MTDVRRFGQAAAATPAIVGAAATQGVAQGQARPARRRRGGGGGERTMRDGDATVMELLRDLAGRMEQLVSRREFEGMDKRVLALEEWRLAQTQREAERLMQLQSQMSSQQLATQQQVSANRTEFDGRILQWFWYVLMLLAGVIAGHIWH